MRPLAVGVHSPEDDHAGEAAQLAGRVRRGDVEAEATLVSRYRSGIAMMVRKRVKDPALADDISQEVFRIAFQALRQGQLKEEEKLAAYLCGIARNLALTELRRARKVPPGESPELLTDSGPGPEDRLLAHERNRLVRLAVAGLPPRDRAVLRAFYLQSTPKEDICRQLRLSPAQFDLIKWRALRRMRKCLEGEQRDE